LLERNTTQSILFYSVSHPMQELGEGIMILGKMTVHKLLMQKKKTGLHEHKCLHSTAPHPPPFHPNYLNTYIFEH